VRQPTRQVRLYRRGALNDGSIERAADRCGFKRVSVTAHLSVFSVGPSWHSWGERVEVFSLHVQDGLAVDVRSESKVAVAYVDFGKNERNVRQFVAALDRLVGKDYVSEPVKLCARCGYPSIDRTAQRCGECGATDLVDTLYPSRKSRLIGGLCTVAVLTAAEAFLVWGANYMGWAGLVPKLFSHPVCGIVNLAVANAGLTVLAWLMHVRRVRKDRRDLASR